MIVASRLLLGLATKKGFQMTSMRRGFTLIELVVVIGVMALVGTLALVSFVNSRRVRDLAASGQNVLSVLRVAQGKSLAGESGVPWGVRLEASRFILFSGASFAGSPTTTAYALPASVEITNIALAGGGTEAVFRRLDGRTDQPGSFDVRVIGSTGQLFSVTLDASGRSYRTGTLPVMTGTRIVDARHRNFALGWSIKDAAVMTLIFSDPLTTTSIIMMPLAPRTDFDWSGTVNVGGQDQTLRIHALEITGTNTTLSIDRDCRKNNKKVMITIDAKTIVTYETDCAAISVDPVFGGIMTEP